MNRPRRSLDWGFPRWRGYAGAREAATVRLCDRHGCDEPGDRPAPKSPNSRERWYFCERHAAEYNRGWNYFEGLSAEEAAAREAGERRDSRGFEQARHYGWGGPGDGSRSRDEMRALDLLELEADAGFEEVRAAVLGAPRDAGKLREDVVAMRARMRGELDRSRDGLFDIKQGQAGLVDLEFLLQYLVLRDARQSPALCAPRDTAGLLGALRAAGLFDDAAFEALRGAHAVLLDAGLRCTLDRRPRLVPVDEVIGAARDAIATAWRSHGLA